MDRSRRPSSWGLPSTGKMRLAVGILLEALRHDHSGPVRHRRYAGGDPWPRLMATEGSTSGSRSLPNRSCGSSMNSATCAREGEGAFTLWREANFCPANLVAQHLNLIGSFSQPQTSTATILGDEFNPSGLESSPNCVEVVAMRRSEPAFKVNNGCSRHFGRVGQVPLAPPKHGSRRTTLFDRDKDHTESRSF